MSGLGKRSLDNNYSVRTEFNNINQVVFRVLQTDQRARNDYKWLIYKVYREFSPIFIPFEDFEKLPSPESVTRCCRKIQNDLGMYKPTEGVRFNRKEREVGVREWSHE